MNCTPNSEHNRFLIIIIFLWGDLKVIHSILCRYGNHEFSTRANPVDEGAHLGKKITQVSSSSPRFFYILAFHCVFCCKFVWDGIIRSKLLWFCSRLYLNQFIEDSLEYLGPYCSTDQMVRVYFLPIVIIAVNIH